MIGAVKRNHLSVLNCGRVPYAEMRARQNAHVGGVLSGSTPEVVFVCEHPSVVTAGARFSRPDSKAENSSVACSGLTCADIPCPGVEFIKTDRGGELTWHGPGQIFIYPVIDLKKRRIGVRQFTSMGLKAISRALGVFGVRCDVSLNPAGVWVQCVEKPKKIASVGLRIVRGVSSHGFSVNVNCDLQPFSLFSPCGLNSSQITNLAEVCPEVVCLKQVRQELSKQFESEFFTDGGRLTNGHECFAHDPVCGLSASAGVESYKSESSKNEFSRNEFSRSEFSIGKE